MKKFLRASKWSDICKKSPNLSWGRSENSKIDTNEEKKKSTLPMTYWLNWKFWTFIFTTLKQWMGQNIKAIYSWKVKSERGSAPTISCVSKNTLRLRVDKKWRSFHMIWNSGIFQGACLKALLEECNTNCFLR